MRPLLIMLFFALLSCAPVPVVSPDSTSTQTAITVKPEVTTPVVTLRNFTAKDIVLGIKAPVTGKPTMYSLPSRSKRLIQIPAGIYNWAATAENSATQKGTRSFANNKTYLWDFNLD